jgi:hypothetical protein
MKLQKVWHGAHPASNLIEPLLKKFWISELDKLFTDFLRKEPECAMKNLQTKCTNEITAVDLFCGAGGLTKGLEDTGIKVNFFVKEILNIRTW